MWDYLVLLWDQGQKHVSGTHTWKIPATSAQKQQNKKILFQPNPKKPKTPQKTQKYCFNVCLPYFSSLLVKLEFLALIILQYDILKTEHLDQAIQQVCLLFGYPMK